MGAWSYYFFLKLYLYATRHIDFHVWPNLALALFVALPARQRWQRVLKQVIAIPAGIVLLYHDSWLPSLDRALAQKDQLTAFSLTYLLELLARFIHWPLVLTLVAMFAAWKLLARRLRLGSFAIAGILAAGLVPTLAQLRPADPAAPGAAAVEAQSLEPAALDRRLAQFFEREAQRRVTLPSPAASAVPFDVIYVQVCSLAWDDLRLIGAENHPLLQGMDFLFTRFDAAASYSGPAAIRLLRSGCGQPHHEGLYQQAAPECHLHEQFQRIGFEPQWAMNHGGIFGNMIADIRNHGGWNAPRLPVQGLPLALKSFDGQEAGYLRDYDVLDRWWQQRLQAPSPRVALYYNTVTLHDGNGFLDGRRPGPEESYRRRSAMLFGDLQKFFDRIAASGRRAVVVLVPEHGAALRGDRRQLSGLREIPTPAITQVPVGIKLVGAAPAPQQRIDTPTSFLALTEFVARLLAQDPFGAGASPAELARDLPQTEPVAENEGTVILQIGGRAMMRTPDGEWSRYDTGN